MSSSRPALLRTYTPAALEAWFRLLAMGWDRHFSPKVLAKGKRLYSQGDALRSLNLTPKTLLVEVKSSTLQGYCIVDLQRQAGQYSLKVRSSFPDSTLGEVLAVAGMCELEALAAEAITPEKAVEAPLEKPIPKAPVVKKVSVVPINLYVGLEKSSLTLRTDAGHKIDRQALIALSKQAHHFKFTYKENQGLFVLENPEAIEVFVREHKESCPECFHYIWTPSAAPLLQKLRYVAPYVTITSADTQDSGALCVEWGLEDDEHVLPLAAAKQLLKGSPKALVPHWGWVALGGDCLQALQTLQALFPSLGKNNKKNVPGYVLHALYAQKDAIRIKAPQALIASAQKALQVQKTYQLPDWLRDYQKEGIAWLKQLEQLGCHGLLADEMGLGKTIQALYALELNPEAHHLVVCPASVISVWEQEIQTHFPQKRIQIITNKTLLDTGGPPCIWLSSYTQLRRQRAQLVQAQFHYAILDEAQMIKNPDAKGTQACLSISCRQRLALTGTPIENKLLDLWTLFRFLMPGFLGPRQLFESQQHSPEFQKNLKAQLAPFILRRTKDKVATQLPPKQYITLACPLTPIQTHHYHHLAKITLAEFGSTWQSMEGRRRWNFLAHLCRLRQICCDPSLVDTELPQGHSAKIHALTERLGSIFDNGHKVVLFSQYTRFLDILRDELKKHFPKIPIFQLTGKTRNRGQLVSSFQNQLGSASILVSLRAGGTGITLHAADYLFLLDPWWNPALEAQAIDRIHRIGQNNPVMIYKLLTPNTIEDHVQALQSQKVTLAEGLLGV